MRLVRGHRSQRGQGPGGSRRRHGRGLTAAYRSAVALILRDPLGRVLIGRKARAPEERHFPQGGIEPGESPRQAAARELREELGIDVPNARLIEGEGTFRYEWPSPEHFKFRGQEMRAFRLDWPLDSAADAAPIRLSETDGTFDALEWVEPAEALARLPEWKRGCFRAILAALGFPLPPL